MAADPKGYSLHIGLNYVDPAHYQGWDGELFACENDADDMLLLASGAGYQTQKLIRSEATRDALFDHVRGAARDLVAGDIFLVSYSGHGGSIPNAPGGDAEVDGRDETWCLFDGQVVDDELELLWREFAAGVRILFISDSCHSETAARLAPPPPPFAIASPAPARPRKMPRAVERRVYLAHRDFYSSIQVAAREGISRAPLECTVRTLSGCLDREYSYDGPDNGEFTGALLTAWNFGRFRGDYAGFHREILRYIDTPQTPQHNVFGRIDPIFDAQRPFTIADDRARAPRLFAPSVDLPEPRAEAAGRTVEA